MTTDININDLEQQKALDHIRELMSAHWREAQDAQDEDGKFGIGFKVSFDRGASPTKLKVTCRISKTFSDEIESEIDDPLQQKLL
jgi:hypothetical protein